MKIVIESIAHELQRYNTLGDWYYDSEGTLQIRISEETGPDGQFLIALHELIEVKLCEKHGVTQQQVDMFDLKYIGNGEPGDHFNAPYRKEHRFAMLIEHLMAHEMGITGYGRVE